MSIINYGIYRKEKTIYRINISRLCDGTYYVGLSSNKGNETYGVKKTY